MIQPRSRALPATCRGSTGRSSLSRRVGLPTRLRPWTASGGTASRQWLPGTPLFNAFAAAGRDIGRCRAVLWQQGESDVIEKASTETHLLAVSQRTNRRLRQTMEQAQGLLRELDEQLTPNR